MAAVLESHSQHVNHAIDSLLHLTAGDDTRDGGQVAPAAVLAAVSDDARRLLLAFLGTGLTAAGGGVYSARLRRIAAAYDPRKPKDQPPPDALRGVDDPGAVHGARAVPEAELRQQPGWGA